MPDNIDRNIATIFLAVAEQAAESNRRGGLPFHTRESVAEDFRREIEPLMKGIAALPEKDGITFTYKDRLIDTLDPVHNAIEMSSPAGTLSFSLRATTIVRGGLYISIGYGTFDKKNVTKSYQEDNGRQSFAEARDVLAGWFAKNAPDRIAELKEVLLPEEAAPSVETQNAVRVGGPLRLKSR